MVHIDGDTVLVLIAMEIDRPSKFDIQISTMNEERTTLQLPKSVAQKKREAAGTGEAESGVTISHGVCAWSVISL